MLDYPCTKVSENVTLIPETVFEIPISGYENTDGLYCLFVIYSVEKNAIITASLYLDTNGEIVDWFALVGELWDDETMYYSITQMNEDGVLGLDMNRLSSSTNTSDNNVYLGYFAFIVSNNGEFYDYNETNDAFLDDFGAIIYDILNDLDAQGALQIINNVDGRGIFVGYVQEKD